MLFIINNTPDCIRIRASNIYVYPDRGKICMYKTLINSYVRPWASRSSSIARGGRQREITSTHLYLPSLRWHVSNEYVITDLPYGRELIIISHKIGTVPLLKKILNLKKMRER